MFCKSQNLELTRTYFDDGMIVWKEYEDSIMLIGIAKGFTEKVLKNLLDLTFSSMVFFVGIHEIRNFKNLEILKRDMKNSLPIIERLMDIAESEFLNYNECIMCPENAELSEKLNDFSFEISSAFCCLMLKQKIACGTEGWWDLHITDRKLLTLLLNSSNSLSKDIPVFLPHKSPDIAYRFISIPITQSANICCLTGAEPTYSDLHNRAQLFWKSHIETLMSSELCFPRNFPSNIELDSGILGLLLLNRHSKKFLLSRNIHQTSSTVKRTLSGTHRLDILRTFFHQSVDIIDDIISNKQIENLEQYWCSDYHKCHALINENNILCVLFIAAIPTHTMR